MKDIIKSKWMIVFVIIIAILTIIDSCSIEQKNVSTGNTDKMQLNK